MDKTCPHFEHLLLMVAHWPISHQALQIIYIVIKKINISTAKVDERRFSKLNETLLFNILNHTFAYFSILTFFKII